VRFSPLFLALSLSLSGWAAPRDASRRAEASSLVAQILTGNRVNAAVSRLQFLGEQAFAAYELSAHLRQGMPDREREQAAWALSQLEARNAESTLLVLLEDQQGAIRMHAARGLGRLRSKAVDRLKPLLNDRSLGVRREAAVALGASGVKRVGKMLLAAARLEGEPEVRAAMLVAIGHSGDRAQRKPLERFLDISSESTRSAAAQALCLLGAPSGFSFVSKLVSSADALERRRGASLLEGSTHAQAIKLLKPLLEDADKAVAAYAARLLHQAGEPKMIEWLVLSSATAADEDKLKFETELENLRLPDEQRRAILAKAGLK
jgi:HEAT repeat protein